MKKLFLCLLCSGSTFAADIYGAYVEVQAGGSNSSAFTSNTMNGAGRIDGGIKIDPYMSVEAGFTGTAAQASNETATALQFYDASFKGTMPISDWFNLHAQLGVAYGTGGDLSAYGTDATMKGLVGAGFDINFSKNFAITVNDYGYLSPDLNANSGVGGNTNLVMGGLKYNF